MAKLRGKTVLITGAANGIGRCTANEFARAGCDLILTDIDGDLLEVVAQQIRAMDAVVQTYVYDVSNQSAVEEMADTVIKSGGVDIVINNAGIGHSGELADTHLKTWHKLMDVNFWGPLHHIYAFLPYMKERRGGHFVNISSGQAFFRLPTWGAYAITKLALGVFSEILHFELRKYDIDVTTVYPFMTRTGFYEDIDGDTWLARLSMRLQPFYSMSPERVAKIIYRAVKRRDRVEMVSVANDLAHYAQFFPLVPDLIARVVDRALAKRPSDESSPVLH